MVKCIQGEYFKIYYNLCVNKTTKALPVVVLDAYFPRIDAPVC